MNRVIFILAILITLISCGGSGKGKEQSAFVKYDYDLCLYNTGNKWEYIDLNDTIYKLTSFYGKHEAGFIDSIINKRYNYPCKHLKQPDSIARYAPEFDKVQGKQKSLSLTFCGAFKKGDMKMLKKNNKIQFSELKNSNTKAANFDPFTISKTEPKEIVIKRSNGKLYNISLDFSFDYTYIWCEQDTFKVLFTNYNKLME
jgi:hypothetical protein